MNSSGNVRLGAGTIFQMADKADPSWRDRARTQDRVEQEFMVQRLADQTASLGAVALNEVDEDDVGDDKAELAPLKTIRLSDRHGKVIPPREWIVEGLIPGRNVTDLSGDGGVGKSLLALQLAVAVATGSPWLGYKATSGKVLYLSAEDEIDEIQRRTTNVAEHQGRTLAELSNLFVVDLTQVAETELARVDPSDHRSLKMTNLFNRLEAQVRVQRPKLLVLDTRADMYGGNEIDRVQVRTFIRSLQRLCRAYDMAILLLSHPSRSGMAAGDGQSGSTAWGNSVRSRLYLKRPDDKDADPDLRVLSSEKANYGALSVQTMLRWRNGVFLVEGAVGGAPPDRAEQNRRAESRVLELLREFETQGRHVNPTAGPNYAPKQFTMADGNYGKSQYQAAISRLLNAHKLKVVKVGRVSKLVEVEADVGARLQELAARGGSDAKQ